MGALGGNSMGCFLNQPYPLITFLSAYDLISFLLLPVLSPAATHTKHSTHSITHSLTLRDTRSYIKLVG